MKGIRLSGSGGQGLILAGIILAEAAIRDGKEAVQTQSYGPEARGGSSKAEVIISPDKILYPKVETPDVLLAMTQEACNKYAAQLKPGGLLLVDETLVPKAPAGNFTIHKLPITQKAKEVLGKELFANIVALGAVVALSGVVSPGALAEALLARVPRGSEEMNKKALALGFDLAKR